MRALTGIDQLPLALARSRGRFDRALPLAHRRATLRRSVVVGCSDADVDRNPQSVDHMPRIQQISPADNPCGDPRCCSQQLHSASRFCRSSQPPPSRWIVRLANGAGVSGRGSVAFQAASRYCTRRRCSPRCAQHNAGRCSRASAPVSARPAPRARPRIEQIAVVLTQRRLPPEQSTNRSAFRTSAAQVRHDPSPTNRASPDGKSDGDLR